MNEKKKKKKITDDDVLFVPCVCYNRLLIINLDNFIQVLCGVDHPHKTGKSCIFLHAVRTYRIRELDDV